MTLSMTPGVTPTWLMTRPSSSSSSCGPAGVGWPVPWFLETSAVPSSGFSHLVVWEVTLITTEPPGDEPLTGSPHTPPPWIHSFPSHVHRQLWNCPNQFKYPCISYFLPCFGGGVGRVLHCRTFPPKTHIPDLSYFIHIVACSKVIGILLEPIDRSHDSASITALKNAEIDQIKMRYWKIETIPDPYILF